MGKMDWEVANLVIKEGSPLLKQIERAAKEWGEEADTQSMIGMKYGDAYKKGLVERSFHVGMQAISDAFKNVNHQYEEHLDPYLDKLKETLSFKRIMELAVSNDKSVRDDINKFFRHTQCIEGVNFGLTDISYEAIDKIHQNWALENDATKAGREGKEFMMLRTEMIGYEECIKDYLFIQDFMEEVMPDTLYNAQGEEITKSKQEVISLFNDALKLTIEEEQNIFLKECHDSYITPSRETLKEDIESGAFLMAAEQKTAIRIMEERADSIIDQLPESVLVAYNVIQPSLESLLEETNINELSDTVDSEKDTSISLSETDNDDHDEI